MASNDWELELNRMLKLIENQATESFEKIDQHFSTMGLSFDDEFRQNVRKLVNLR